MPWASPVMVRPFLSPLVSSLVFSSPAMMFLRPSIHDQFFVVPCGVKRARLVTFLSLGVLSLGVGLPYFLSRNFLAPSTRFFSSGLVTAALNCLAWSARLTLA